MRLLSAAVLAITVSSVVAGFFVTRSVVASEQRRLLKDRADEAALLVESLFTPVTTALPNLAATSLSSPQGIAQFRSQAQKDLGLTDAIGALEYKGGSYSSLVSVGAGLAPGAPVGVDRATLAARAIATKAMVSAVLATPQGRRLSLSLATGSGVVLYEDMAFDPSKPINLDSAGVFSDLDGAIYTSTQPDPNSLVVATTTHLPLSGQVSAQTISVGPQQWLLVVKSRSPLVGPLAEWAPWALLIGGVLGAALATLLVEALGRRRSYALALVDQRTVALREAEAAERQAREAAESANRAKSEFLSRMSHELRTPLNAVIGFGQLLELDDLGSDQQEAVSQILKGGRHLLDLINEVLDISRIETGNLTLSHEAVSVSEVVGDVVVLLRTLANQRSISLRIQDLDHGATDGTHVLADRQRLKQILLNLVSNAIKYNHEGGSVIVSVDSPDPARCQIIVTDTGPGIPSEGLSKLFVPFERLGAETTGVEGTGVGLALSRRLAEAMGGTIDVRSVVGQGSRFWVELPVTEGPLERYERLHGGVVEDAQPVAEEQSVERRTVLYIEDNLSNLRLIERVLSQREDIQLLPAMQGRLGLTLARNHHPDVILLDLHLPDLNGEQVLDELRDDPLTADIPVVILSADATPRQVERLEAAGATAYLTKPVDIKQLIDVLAQQLTPAAVAPSNPSS